MLTLTQELVFAQRFHLKTLLNATPLCTKRLLLSNTVNATLVLVLKLEVSSIGKTQETLRIECTILLRERLILTLTR